MRGVANLHRCPASEYAAPQLGGLLLRLFEDPRDRKLQICVPLLAPAKNPAPRRLSSRSRFFRKFGPILLESSYSVLTLPNLIALKFTVGDSSMRQMVSSLPLDPKGAQPNDKAGMTEQESASDAKRNNCHPRRL